MNNKNLYLVIAIFFLSLFFLWSSNNTLFKNIEGRIASKSIKLIEPIDNFSSKIINMIYDYDSVEKLKERNIALSQKNTNLEVVNIQLQEKISLLESFSKINTETFATKEIIAANVIFKDPALGRNIIQVNRGNKHEIETGLAVVGLSGSLIGIISEVYDDF